MQSQRTWQPALLGLVLFGMILASGCLFTSRDPAQPLDSNVDWIRPIEPEAVIVNMETALEALQALNYENSLAEDFLFIPHSVDVQEAPAGYYIGWGKSRENAAVDKLYEQVDSLRVEWNFDLNLDLTDFGDSAVVWMGIDDDDVDREPYQLIVSYTNGEQIVFEGAARLTLRDEGGQWFLSVWDESFEGFDNSWGRLRANLDIGH